MGLWIECDGLIPGVVARHVALAAVDAHILTQCNIELRDVETYHWLVFDINTCKVTSVILTHSVCCDHQQLNILNIDDVTSSMMATACCLLSSCAYEPIIGRARPIISRTVGTFFLATSAGRIGRGISSSDSKSARSFSRAIAEDFSFLYDPKFGSCYQYNELRVHVQIGRCIHRIILKL